MYVEKRKDGKNIKYYIVYSHRENKKVKKIRRYLGANLSKDKLEKLKKTAEKYIIQQIEELNTEIFSFTLTKKQIERLNNYKIKIHHLDKKDWERFTEDFVYNTNAIEGSTVLKEEVHEILQKKKPKDPDEIETQGVAKAVNFIKKTKQDLSLPLMLKLHEMCFKGSKNFAGKFRNVEVVIRNASGEIIHQGILVHELKGALEECISWYQKNKKKFKPLVLAAIIHNQFENIHPFQDGNGRVGRLLLNFILLKNNYPPINILLEDRQEYYRTLQEYSKHQNLKPTMDFLVKQYKKTLKKVSTNKN